MAPGLSVGDFIAQQHAAPHALPWMAPWQGTAWCGARCLDTPRWLAQARRRAGIDDCFDFVPAGAEQEGEAYEVFIARTRSIPTRHNLHDLFNGLVWLRLPRTKTQMNALHVAELAQARPGGRRGPLRDALTVFDENGAVLHAPPALWQALQARQWRRLFVELRPLWREACLTVVGHALLEQLATAPRKPLTAHVLCAPAPAEAAALDRWLAHELADTTRLRAKPFTPLPVLGVPGWWAANEAPAFYDDPAVFRPPRAA